MSARLTLLPFGDPEPAIPEAELDYGLYAPIRQLWVGGRFPTFDAADTARKRLEDPTTIWVVRSDVDVVELFSKLRGIRR